MYRRTTDRELAGDISQQVFLKALLALSKFQFRGVPFSAWLFRIAVNECNEFFRKTNRTRAVSIDERMVQLLHDELTYDTTTDDLSAQLPSLLLTLKEDEPTYIEPRLEAKFHSSSYGHRPLKSTHGAVEAVRENVRQPTPMAWKDF